MKQFGDYFDCVLYLETERFILVPFEREERSCSDRKSGLYTCS